MAWGGDGYTGATAKFTVAVLVPGKASGPYPLLAQNREVECALHGRHVFGRIHGDIY
jgi:hypothetical protein